MIAYAKGARTFERHIDIDADGIPVSPYCTLPEQVDTWFKAFHKAKAICGGSGLSKRIPPEKEDQLSRQSRPGRLRRATSRRDTSSIMTTSTMTFIWRSRSQKGQVSCRELMSGEVLLKACLKDEPVLIDMIESPYSYNDDLKRIIYERGI